jgi:hypothetical protein
MHMGMVRKIEIAERRRVNTRVRRFGFVPGSPYATSERRMHVVLITISALDSKRHQLWSNEVRRTSANQHRPAIASVLK